MDVIDFAVTKLKETERGNTDQIKHHADQIKLLSLKAVNSSLVQESTSTQLSESLDKLEKGLSAHDASISNLEAGNNAPDPLILVALACGVIALLLGLASLVISIKASRGSKMSEQMKSV